MSPFLSQGLSLCFAVVSLFTHSLWFVPSWQRKHVYFIAYHSRGTRIKSLLDGLISELQERPTSLLLLASFAASLLAWDTANRAFLKINAITTNKSALQLLVNHKVSFLPLSIWMGSMLSHVHIPVYIVSMRSVSWNLSCLLFPSCLLLGLVVPGSGPQGLVAPLEEAYGHAAI